MGTPEQIAPPGPGEACLDAEGPSPRVRHLLAVARHAFVTQGFAATSIDAIAREGGVSKETVYRHFADKAALFRAALEDQAQAFVRRTEAVHAAAPTPREELAQLARAILDAAIESGLLSPVQAAIEVAQDMPDFASALERRHWQTLEPVRRALAAQAALHGRAGVVPAELAIDFGSLAVEGPRLMFGFDAPAAERRGLVAGAVADLFAAGLATVVAPSLPAPSLDAAADLPSHIAHLLDVAAEHFLNDGYAGASLDRIGAEARVGRGTLYRHFSGKHGLFVAAMRRAAMLLAPAPRALRSPPPASGAGVEDIAGWLLHALEALGHPRVLRLQRTAIAESRRDPALAREVYHRLRAPWQEPLALAIAGLRPSGEAALDQARWLAAQALVLAHRGNRLFLRPDPLGKTEAAAQANRAAAVLLGGVAAIA